MGKGGCVLQLTRLSDLRGTPILQYVQRFHQAKRGIVLEPYSTHGHANH